MNTAQTILIDEVSMIATDTMAYVGQCETFRSPVNPYNMLTIISDEPLPSKVPGGTEHPIKLLFKISGDYTNVIAPYRQGKSVSYDLPSLDILEPYRLHIDDKMKYNKELGFDYEDSWITNPYCASPPYIACDPFEEYGKTHEELLVIFKSEEYLRWLKIMGDGCFADEDCECDEC